MTWRIQVLVALPKHSPLQGLLDYTSVRPVAAGTLVRVPLGRRLLLGLVWGCDLQDLSAAAALSERDTTRTDTASVGHAETDAVALTLRPIGEVLDAVPALPVGWCRVVEFAARYYQRSVGELALACLPSDLRDLDGTQLARRLQRLSKRLAPSPASRPGRSPTISQRCFRAAAAYGGAGQRRAAPA